MVTTYREWKWAVLGPPTETERDADRAAGWVTDQENPTYDLRNPRRVTLKQRPAPEGVSD